MSICYLVGAGPGDPGLMTLRARECIEKADVILYDYLVSPEILRWLPESAERIFVGKQAGRHTMPQEEINQLLVEKTASGKCVVRLKGGDPFVFGRGGEEALALAEHGLAFEIVPGISSSIAGPAYAGIPVTHRGASAQFTVFTGHEDPGKPEEVLDFSALARAHGTKIVLMGMERLSSIASALQEHGMDAETPVGVIHRATTSAQRTVVGTLRDIAARVQDCGIKPPAVVVIGDVVRLRERLAWFESRPLLGQRVVVTRSRSQAGALSSRLHALGADVLEMPTISIQPPTDPEAFDAFVNEARTYNWMVFTSPNGVQAFFERYYALGNDARDLGGVRIAAIGAATARRIWDYRLRAEVCPEKFVAEALLESLLATGSVENQTFLLVRAETGREILPDELTAHGAIVDVAIAYRTVPASADTTGVQSQFRAHGADWLTFTSSSTVEHFIALKIPVPSETRIASIGPVTSGTLRAAGMRVDVEAVRHDIEGLIEAIVKATK